MSIPVKQDDNADQGRRAQQPQVLRKRALIVLTSIHHKNTEKVAIVIAKIIGAEIVSPEEMYNKNLSSYELIGFGSGIYSGKHHRSLLDLADKLSPVHGQLSFIFSTSGRTGKIVEKYHRRLRDRLVAKGFVIVDEFNCAGFDTVGLKKLFGGIKKGRPNLEDLALADTFAKKIRTGV